ncbi:hypothetical protein Cgig2_006550 [Carnegiea gigantea]|uniref:Uncharacterized protein n=1 Tax=Carnegiea gigantea TaxID=171969 RepID=A0A9Q1JVF8_9CARY|nr:hypothetical protein Cgig2_006550 [Carnegiea gigantea]
MWYSLKCNRLESLSLGRDGDVKKFMKGNDEYAYLYVEGSQGPYVGRVHGNEACEEQWRGVAVLTVGGVGQRSMLQVMSLVRWMGECGHTQNPGLKVDKRKTELKKWKNGVGDRIEKKLRKTLGNIESVLISKMNTTEDESMPIDMDLNGEEEVAEIDSRQARKTTSVYTGVYKPVVDHKRPKHQRKLTCTI